MICFKFQLSYISMHSNISISSSNHILRRLSNVGFLKRWYSSWSYWAHYHLTIRAHLTWRKRMAVLTVCRYCLRDTYSSSGVASHWVVGRVASTKPQLIRGAEALLVCYSSGVAFFLLLLLQIKKNWMVFGVRSLGYSGLSWAYQVGHCTELVGSTLNSFTLNRRVTKFIEKVLLVILFWLWLRSVVLDFCWNELGHLVGSSFWRKST